MGIGKVPLIGARRLLEADLSYKKNYLFKIFLGMTIYVHKLFCKFFKK